MSFIGILIVIVCVVLGLIVLVQNSKGGGLASNFSSSNQILGVAKTKDILEQITWIAAGLLFILCLVSTPKSQTAGKGDGKTDQATETSITKQKASTFGGSKQLVPNNNPTPGGGTTGK